MNEDIYLKLANLVKQLSKAKKDIKNLKLKISLIEEFIRKNIIVDDASQL